jgi:hypothetical protein
LAGDLHCELKKVDSVKRWRLSEVQA